MKIALFNCVMRQVPPVKSGGIEKIMYYLADGAAKRGHSVTLFSTKGSIIPNTELVAAPTLGFEYEDLDDQSREEQNTFWTNQLGDMLVDRAAEFDVIHNHCLEAGLSTCSRLGKNSFSTIHEFLDGNAARRLSPHKKMKFVSISMEQRKYLSSLNYIANIYHGIDVHTYPQVASPEGYLAFVGRISAQKRPDLAIRAAGKLKKKLLILGKYKDQSVERDYYENLFLPALNEYSQYVEWVGEVEEREVKNILNKAEASLLPVGFPEPFGLAAVESMAAGCPVVAFRSGAYPETIVEGKTGFLAHDLGEMIQKIKLVGMINRKHCRQHVARHFSVERMVDQYISLYEEIALEHGLYNRRFQTARAMKTL